VGDKLSVALSLILENIPLINVLLVDDHELVRAGIRRILEDIKGIKVAGEACCGEDAVKWCRANPVDVVLMDMNMPGIGALRPREKLPVPLPMLKSLCLPCIRKIRCRQK
jgi:two-component system invasion response regulator UvrY